MVNVWWANSWQLRQWIADNQGYLALGGFTGLWLLSIRIVRRRAYELFLLSHIVLSMYVHLWHTGVDETDVQEHSSLAGASIGR